MLMRRTRLWSLCLLLSVSLCAVLAGAKQNASNTPAQPERRVAITVDDLPGAVPATPMANGELSELQRYNEAIPAF